MKPYQDLLDTVAGHNYYATIDLKHGFYNIPIHDQATKDLLGFTLPSGARFCFRKMPTGCSDAPQILEYILADVLHKYQWKCLCIYLDDIAIWADTREELIGNLKAVVALLRDVGFLS